MTILQDMISLNKIEGNMAMWENVSKWFKKLSQKDVTKENNEKLLKMIRDANPDRNFQTLNRRFIKVMEELGEASEAFLNVTSTFNGKNKSEDDLIEELVDTMVVVVDCVLTKPPSFVEMSDEEYEDKIMQILETKLQKWATNKAKQKSVVDDAEWMN